jgi:hypothetical protein
MQETWLKELSKREEDVKCSQPINMAKTEIVCLRQ